MLRWVDPSCAESVCAWCMRCLPDVTAANVNNATRNAPHRCQGGCDGRISWCSKACATAHAPSHEPVCHMLGYATNLPNSTNGVVKAHRSREEGGANGDENEWSREEARAVDLLVSLGIGILGLRIGHGPLAAQTAVSQWSQSIPLDDIECATAAAAAARVQAALRLLPSNQRRTMVGAGCPQSASEFEWLLRLDKANSFSFPALPSHRFAARSGSGRRGRGVGVFPAMALANHSCWPNVVRSANRLDD
eukprot:SAG31_NODE_1672_length_7564_cov_10.193704_2_plen_249_part_00